MLRQTEVLITVALLLITFNKGALNKYVLLFYSSLSSNFENS